MTERFRVLLDKEAFTFCAAHFITYSGDICEPLHGHNYHVTCELGGPLDDNHYVVDFIALRDTLQGITQELDHRVLLPTEHPLIQVQSDELEVVATFRERRWVFPRTDCVLLPLANTTAELLARHIGQRLFEALQARLQWRPDDLLVQVDECDGQWGVYHWTADDS